MAYLNGRHGILLGDELRNARERVALLVIPQPETLFGDTPPRFDVGCLHANDAGAADGARGKMREMPVVRHPVDGGILAHRRHHDAVLDLHRP